MKIRDLMFRPSDVARSIEDGVIGAVVLVRETLHGIKRDVLIEHTARQMAKAASREMSERDTKEFLEDTRKIAARFDQLMEKRHAAHRDVR